MLSLCNHWEFTPCWTEAFGLGAGEATAVRLPHTVKEVPQHYADSGSYQMVCGYRRQLPWQAAWEGKRIFLQFDGAAHIATVYVNGREAGSHRTGYTGFRVELTELLTRGDNLLSVKLDTTENGEVPPFGFVIDYLTYGGLYREVWLDVREQSYIEDIFVTTPTLHTAHVELKTVGADRCRLSVLDEDGHCLLTREHSGQADLELPEAKSWTLEEPCRYVLRCELLDDRGRAVDTQQVKFGFRTIRFDENHFYLNGERTFLRGLNRHQCYPYMGYAAPESLQREDARILKYELGCTAVRTSHYPQSHYFLDECDRIGLLVFTEIPGWQHIGGDAWKDQAVENTREMVLQYRNHPSIILWGVRINESLDDDGLYARTNAVARELDPSRPTSGVRYLEKSHMLEDVCGFNDFSHTGDNPGVRTKKKSMADTAKPLIVTEHNGHMFPTKSFDTWQRRQEQALRHAQVQNDALADGGHAGCFGWCMFDYPTHRDFGSGDRVCYHGVLDAFRNPKTAAWVYASQQEKVPVLAVSSPMDIGDYPAGNIGDVYVFSNADEVRLYKNDTYVTTLSGSRWQELPHGPILLNDTIGTLLEKEEGYGPKKAAAVKKVLLAASRYGIFSMPLKYNLLTLWVMLRYRLTVSDGYRLHGKYVANWGGAATSWRFEAVKDGAVTASAVCAHSAKLHLELVPGKTVLREGATYDAAAVRIRVRDENGTVAAYAQLPVKLTVTGPAERIGPEVVCAEGGMTGTYIRTTGEPGEVTLTASAAGLEDVSVTFRVEA